MASHGPQADSLARSAASVRSPRSTRTPATSAPERPRLKVVTSHPRLRAVLTTAWPTNWVPPRTSKRIPLSCQLDHGRSRGLYRFASSGAWLLAMGTGAPGSGKDANGRSLDADGERTAATRLGQPLRQRRPDVPLCNRVRSAATSLYGLRGLENHCGGNVTVGSNPTPSASDLKNRI